MLLYVFENHSCPFFLFLNYTCKKVLLLLPVSHLLFFAIDLNFAHLFKELILCLA